MGRSIRPQDFYNSVVFLFCALGGSLSKLLYLLGIHVSLEGIGFDSHRLPATRSSHLLAVSLTKCSQNIAPPFSTQILTILGASHTQHNEHLNLRMKAKQLAFIASRKTSSCFALVHKLRLCPRRDSNPHFRLRRPLFYPLNYEGRTPT